MGISGLILAPAGAGPSDEPTPTPTATLTPAQAALARQFAEQVGPAPMIQDACGFEHLNPAGEEYNQRLVAAVTSLLAHPDTYAFDPTTLESVIRAGIEHSYPPRMYGPPAVVYESGPETVLAYISHICCATSHHRPSLLGGLYVFSRSGESWFLGNANSARAQESVDGWIALVDLSPSGIHTDYHVGLWQITPTDGEWGVSQIDNFGVLNPVRDFEVDQERLIVYLRDYFVDPPCPFTEELEIYGIWGEFTRVYERIQDTYSLVDETLDTPHVYNVYIKTNDDITEVEDWQTYCEE